jgi:hypothetical protein
VRSPGSAFSPEGKSRNLSSERFYYFYSILRNNKIILNNMMPEGNLILSGTDDSFFSSGKMLMH